VSDFQPGDRVEWDGAIGTLVRYNPNGYECTDHDCPGHGAPTWVIKFDSGRVKTSCCEASMAHVKWGDLTAAQIKDMHDYMFDVLCPT
jgi:hypothetical protein